MLATTHLKRKEKVRCEEELLKLIPRLERIGLTVRIDDDTEVFRKVWVYDSQEFSYSEAEHPKNQTDDIYAVCGSRGCLHCQINNRGIFILKQLSKLADKLFEISDQESFAMELGCLIETDLDAHLVTVTLSDGKKGMPFELQDDDIVDTLYQLLISVQKKNT